jgi:isopenicillin-N N-acyltransferase-like protein
VTGLRVVRAEGEALARGRTIGRELAEPINTSIDFYHRYLDRRGVSSPRLQELLAPYLAAAEIHAAEYMLMIRGMSEGAMVPFLELFAINAFEELEALLEPVEGVPLFLHSKEGRATKGARADRCTAFTSIGDGYNLLGHNENWLAGDIGNVAIVVEVPEDRELSIVSPTVVCCLPAVGMNARGGAQSIQSLTASDDGAGVPRVIVSRHSLPASGRESALRRATMNDRAGGYSHVYAFWEGEPFAIETTGERHAILEGPLGHTNHYLDPALAEIGSDPSPGSLSRYERLQQLLAEPPRTLEEAAAVLSDHDGSPQSICLHPKEGEGDEASAVVFSMVCDLKERRMWVSSGSPCETPYEEVDLTEVW